jgi:hypothetical protein
MDVRDELLFPPAPSAEIKLRRGVNGWGWTSAIHYGGRACVWFAAGFIVAHKLLWNTRTIQRQSTILLETCALTGEDSIISAVGGSQRIQNLRLNGQILWEVWSAVDRNKIKRNSHVRGIGFDHSSNPGFAFGSQLCYPKTQNRVGLKSPPI